MRKEKLVELRNYIDELRTVSKTKVNDNSKFITSDVYECLLNNGKMIMREKLLKGKKDGSAVLVLPYTNDEEVILSIEPRVFSKRTVGIGIPAGYIEDNEMPIEAAKRELLEETGYTSNDLKYLGGFYQDMGCSSAFNQIFLAMNAVDTGKQYLDQDEYVRPFKCTYDEALELIDMEYIQGANTIITLEKAKKYIKG